MSDQNEDNIFNADQRKGMSFGIYARIVRGSLSSQNSGKRLIGTRIEGRTGIFNSFAIKAFNSLPQRHYHKNHVISPLNLIVDLSILMVGSNGDSYTDLRNVLNFDSYSCDSQTFLKTIQTIYRAVNYERYKMAPNYHLFNINRLFLHRNAKTSEMFKNRIKMYFNVDIDKIDFNRDGHLIRDQIKELLTVNLKNKKIHGFETIINEKTQLMTLSAVHFKCKCHFEFPIVWREDGVFYNHGKIAVCTRLMFFRDLICKVANNIKWNASIIELPLLNRCMNFYIILPKMRTGLSYLLKQFNYVSLMNTLNGLHLIRCNLLLPKFKLECDYDFGQQYSHLKVFTEEAELQTIGGRHKLKANNILHKVIFEMVEPGPLDQSKQHLVKPPELKEIKIEHPFLFIVRDERTGAFIFIGKVQCL